MRQLFQVGVLGPHGLGGHLGQLHGRQGGAEPPIAREDVYTGLDEPDGLAEDLLCIRLQLGTQLHAGQVGLQKQVGLDVWVVELRVIQLVGTFWASCRRRLSSWCRMGMFSYSAALEMISMSPRTLVLAFRDMLKSSMVV